MSEQNKAIVRRLFEEVWNRGDWVAAGEITGPDYRQADRAVPPTRATGPRALQHEVQAYRAAFPDLQVMIEEMIAEGDKVVVAWTARGTHLGPAPFSSGGAGDWLYLPPTRQELRAAGVTIHHLVDGKIVATRLFWHPMSLLRELGVPLSRLEAIADPEATR